MRVNPGSHFVFEDFFQKRGGVYIIDNGVPYELGFEHEAVLSTKPGDVIIMHHMIAHEVLCKRRESSVYVVRVL